MFSLLFLVHTRSFFMVFSVPGRYWEDARSEYHVFGCGNDDLNAKFGILCNSDGRLPFLLIFIDFIGPVRSFRRMIVCWGQYISLYTKAYNYVTLLPICVKDGKKDTNEHLFNQRRKPPHQKTRQRRRTPL